MRLDEIPVIDIHTAVVGSGAAGLNSADRLRQYGVEDLALITENMNSGTSRNTGSDKQTYYKLSLAGDAPDSVRRLAQILYEGGCVDGEHALCEAALSCQGFFKLVELGVPFPHDIFGQFVGYKTDHDPNDRGTSVGPYTSRYMTEALEQAVREKQIQIYDHHQVIEILTKSGEIYGLLCLKTEEAQGNPYVIFRCQNVVYATGGPAGMYGDSVYPSSQFGASGLAFEAGVKGKNLTEWQYGLASLKPRWNVSGSYMQALPRVVSTDKNGKDEREFLMDFYESWEEALSHLFLKGYQWPFDARKAAGGSSMIDLLVYRETCVRGRRVWLDYQKNPGEAPIRFEGLSEEAREYLEKSGACGQTPYERLCQLNVPAVEFYKEHGVDLKKEMLEVAVCAQHNNGGLLTDAWWQTNIEGFFCAGEAAATHGIYRPGGSALNSGQVGSTRAAQYIAAHKEETRKWEAADDCEMKEAALKRIRMGQAVAGQFAFGVKWRKAVRDMSCFGAMLRDENGMRQMEEEIFSELLQLQDQKEENEKTADTAQLSRFFRYYDMRLSQGVYLAAMLDYREHGCRSRGSAIYLEEPSGKEDQSVIPELAVFSLDGSDGMAHKAEIQETSYCREKNKSSFSWRPVHPLTDMGHQEAFEVVWKNYREGRLYDQP